tara:strand:+ start:6170 stop:6571 length:402 start_codon:yes stop_codon:yes gene_type:complete
MFTKEQLQGILLSLARPEVTFYRSNATDTGQTIRLRVNFRAETPFLQAIERTLDQYQIEYVYRESEGANRDKPLLYVGRRDSLIKLSNLLPELLPASNNQWNPFLVALEKVKDGQHLTLDGMTLIKEAVNDAK